MKTNIWTKLDEIHQRWLTNEKIVDVVKDILISIQNSDKELFKSIPTEYIIGTSFYTNKISTQTNFVNTSINGHPVCLSPRPQTPPTNLYPAKSPRSPRRTFSSFDYKKDRNQTATQEELITSINSQKENSKPISHKDRVTDHNQKSLSPKDNIKKTNVQSMKSQFDNSSNIPRFFYHKGKPASNKEIDQTLSLIKENLLDLVSYDLLIPRSKLPELVKILKIPLYWKQPVYLYCGGRDNKPIKVDDVISCWRILLNNCGTEAAKFMHIMTCGSTRNYLERSDFEPLVQDVLETHPGLQFLQSSVDFHVHYINTVIVRIFFNLDRYWNDRITLAELSKSDLIWVIKYLETHDDINMVTQYFSYEHFYVIYCKFWELDTDHNLIISKSDLARHNNCALSDLIIERIFSGTVLRKPSDQKLMTYPEFVWFLLAEEDKRHPRSIEYWFRLMDLDGDGVLSMFELEFFYEEQLRKMEELCIDPVSFTDCMCMMLDMIKPRAPDHIALTDLKACRLCHIFFDTFLNLPKYLDHEQRDPFNNLRDIEEGLNEISDWDRFASEAYELLVSEDGQQQAGISSDEYNYEDDFETDETGIHVKPGYSHELQISHNTNVVAKDISFSSVANDRIGRT